MQTLLAYRHTILVTLMAAFLALVNPFELAQPIAGILALTILPFLGIERLAILESDLDL